MSQNIPTEEIEETLNDTSVTNDSGSLKKEKIDVEYGDIIQLISPSNSEYHESMFFVNYIDENKAKLLNIATNQLIELAIREDTTGFTDESILIVYLLDRSKIPGFARQKGLITGVWVDIHFHKLPTITAEITNLEEDQIELTTYPALKILYIDFGYRGIPEDIPIEKFVIREKPAILKNASSLSSLREQVANDYSNESNEPTQEFLPNGESITYIPDDAEPVENIKSKLREQYIKTQPIKRGVMFGEYLDVVEQFVEVAENKKRYNIDVQINSYMDELLSTIPYSERTNKIMTRIHILVERYKELREMYSDFDDAGNVKSLKYKNPKMHKPLKEHIQKMDVKLPWIVPIVTNIKNVYEDRELPLYDQADIEKYDQDIVIYNEQEMIDNLFYNSANDQNKYTNLYRQLNANFMTPMKMPANDNEIIHKIPVSITSEAFVENRRNIYSSAVKNDELANIRFFQQTYTAPLTYMAKEQRFKEKNYYVKKTLTDTDEMAVQSLLTLPMPVMQYTRAFLPNTPLYDRVQLSSLVYMPSFFLNKKTDVNRIEINDLSRELDDSELKENEEGDNEKKLQYLTTITQYILNTKLEDTNKFEKFLQVVIPNAWTIIRFINKTQKQYSFRSIVSMLEPFMIYEKDISYTQYKLISKIIRKKIEEFKKSFQEKTREFSDYKNYKYDVAKKPDLIPNIFSEKRELTELLYTGYKIGGPLEKPKELKHTNDEILHKMLTTDDAELFTLLMQSLMIPLVTHDSILNTEEPTEIDWMDENGRNRADCGIQVLAKKYTKIDDLLKDNGNEDVFFDKEFDQTNYSIMKKYEKEKKEMLDEQKFADFLAENLVQKHDVDRQKSAELTQILIAGKKRVSEGQYAVLEIAPKLPKDTASLDSDNFEMEARTKYTYYIRKKNQWVHEESLDEMAFMDSATLFCNLKSLKCIKNTDDKSADKACEFGSAYLYKLEHKKAVKEFERRYDVTRDSLEKTLETKIIKQTRLSSRIQTLLSIQREKTNLLAYHLGLRAQHIGDDLIVSPRAELLRKIYGQKDFIEKQIYIVKFFEKYCREPMVAERDEDPYWKYCIDTNTKLIPSFVCELANQFVYFGEQSYAAKLNEIISVQGIEEDGFIYDRHTHEVIKKIDNVQEDQFNEAGFRVITNAVIEQDIGSIVRDKLKQKQRRVFNDELSEEIYKIYAALSARIAPFSEEVWQKVNELSSGFIKNPKIIAEESVYNKQSQANEKKTGKKAISYEKMRDKKMVQIVASVLLIIIQTSIPSFKGNKTFPGCVLSFEGFPLNGEENLRGIEYIACILKGISSSDIKPWDSVSKIGVNLMKEQMKELIQKFMVNDSKISGILEKKHEYLAQAPLVEQDIPYEHRIEKWQQFMPPLKDVPIELQPIGSGFIKEFWSLMRQGNKDQTKQELAIKSKVALYGYAIIDKIQEIVKTKTLLLKTSGNMPYLQNACCNEQTKSKKAIQYFAEEEGSPIQQYIRSVYELSKMMNRIHLFTVSAFVRNTFSFHPKPVMPTEIMEENIYLAFIHYCGLDRGKIPLEFRGFFAEIPDSYNSKATLVEKIGIIKRTKRIDKEDMDHLMRVVRQRNTVHLVNPNVPSIIERFQDVLTQFDKGSSSEIVNVDSMLELDTNIRGSLRALLDSYDPNKLYSIDMEVEQTSNLDKLKRELNEANEYLFKRIIRFMDKYLKMKKSDLDNISEFLYSIDIWNIDRESTKLPNYYDTGFYRVQQYFKNAIYDLTHYFPSLIINRGNKNTGVNFEGDEKIGKSSNPNERIHKYWNLSIYDENDLKKTIKKYQEGLYKFQEDEVIQDLIMSIQPKLIDLNSWINEMPVFSSLLKDREYFHLFDKSCVQSLDKYLIYTAIYQYIKAASERVILQKERENVKQKKRDDISESRDQFLSGTFEQDMEEEYDNMDEIQMMEDEGEQEELNNRVSNFLMIFLNMYKDNKKKMDYTYADIERNMNIERNKEKERIMKRFTKDDKGNDKKEDERKIEFAKKKVGLGIWNAGKQKSMFQYDKKTSDRERVEILQQQELIEGVEELVNEGDNVNLEEGLRTIEEIDDENGEDEQDEGFDIGDYNAENDGGYYPEDRGENEFNEDEF